MAAAKLTYLGSATLMENFLELLLPDPAVAYCRKQPSERLRQLAQDYLTGQRFRRDVFVRGHPRLPRGETVRNLQQACFALPGPIEDFTQKTTVPRGEITFDAKIVAAVGEVLAKGSASLADLAAASAGKLKKPAELERTVLMMAAVGRLVPVATAFQPAALPAKPGKIRIALPINRALVAAGREEMAREYLVSPATGSGLVVDSIDALALTLLEEDVPVGKLAAAVAEELRRRGIRVNKDGVPVTDPKEAEARTGELVGRFLTRTLVTLMRYGVVEPV
jgi:hypothetical protein